MRRLADWEPYLRKHSGLPGPRANLELLAAVVEEGDARRFRRLAASNDEYLAACGAAGLGRIAIRSRASSMRTLHRLASDPRWRVREGVAIGLQRFGKEEMHDLLNAMREWSQDGPYVQRAAVAALCEPALLARREDVVAVLDVLDDITRSLASTTDRRGDGFRVLRQALGYGWSVAAAAAPREAKPYFERWMRSTDKDVQWIIRSNLGKARIATLATELAR
ncbi:MAG TPA: HEAT repeat domain-containing protein [Actinomycetota bacterium]|nr:HEAT repeat domain-containing protein [Actinomycetota bacterium]